MGNISYDLGAALEPRARAATAHSKPDTPWPLAQWFRCDEALIFDRQSRRWWSLGGLRFPSGPRHVDARGMEAGFQLGPLQSATGKPAYIRAAARVLEYIRAGDAYQVNLAHQLAGSFTGSSRGLFAALVQQAGPWYGAYTECRQGSRGRSLLSLSPELFLTYDPRTRRLITRPMKGTRPGAGSPTELDSSPKDRAELTMIVDLMRNDLGRVCSYGSVRVDASRNIERHGSTPAGVLQATATVSGTLRPGLDVADALRATFPGGSVTGAPKIRAMQIIDELEPAARGPYCGAVGYLTDDGHASFNIAIRTALIEGHAPEGPGRFQAATLRYSVGAGIVSDSDPEAEWRETLDKAGAILSLAGDVSTLRAIRPEPVQ